MILPDLTEENQRTLSKAQNQSHKLVTHDPHGVPPVQLQDNQVGSCLVGGRAGWMSLHLTDTVMYNV